MRPVTDLDAHRARRDAQRDADRAAVIARHPSNYYRPGTDEHRAAIRAHRDGITRLRDALRDLDRT